MSEENEATNSELSVSGSPKWWVNQGRSYKEERNGAYVWAPQKAKNGITIGHHTAVLDIRQGDTIVHYSKGKVRAVGVATSDGYEAQRPIGLPGDVWASDGLKADVNYLELENPIKLSDIDSAIRSAAGGPFDVNGGVKQGYLFELPAATRDEIGLLLPGGRPSSNKSPRLWAVYVGTASESNLNFSLPRGQWGWKSTHAEYDQMAPGDMIIFAAGYSGGSPRVQLEEFVQHNISRLVTCSVTSPLYEDSERFWPDEDDDTSYPFRVKLELIENSSNIQIGEIDQIFGGPVAEAIRMSAARQGRGELVEVSKQMQVEAVPFDQVVQAFVEATRGSGLDYGARHEKLVRSFVTALATKPFVILTGLSGSGKTRLAQAFGHWLGAAKVVAVRPDWTSPDSLLGFENALSEPEDGRYAWNVPETLQFILDARSNQAQPHLLLLDEMNLAHVERYFADILSGMESGEAVIPDLVKGGDGNYRWRSGSDTSVSLPPNLFVVGTVNIDETTYMFSPKVLDRANTFEFRVETSDLKASREPSRLARANPGNVAGFMSAASSESDTSDATFAGWLQDVHEMLAQSDREFGHRTFQEGLRFAGLLKQAGEGESRVALDLQIAQKVLPRLHGSRRELSDLLNQLGGFCFVGPGQDQPKDFVCAEEAKIQDAALPTSYSKLHRMAKKLRDNHFVSFAE